jgi:hypothetical protein
MGHLHLPCAQDGRFPGVLHGWPPTQHFAGSIWLSPRYGSPGVVINAKGVGFAARELVRLTFVDPVRGRIVLVKLRTDWSGAFTTHVTIPLTATPGVQHLMAMGLTSREIVRRAFTVT